MHVCPCLGMPWVHLCMLQWVQLSKLHRRMPMCWLYFDLGSNEFRNFRKKLKPLQLVFFLHLEFTWKIWRHSKFIKKITCIGMVSSGLPFGGVSDNLIFSTSLKWSHLLILTYRAHIYWKLFCKLFKIFSSTKRYTTWNGHEEVISQVQSGILVYLSRILGHDFMRVLTILGFWGCWSLFWPKQC
jgi:hypothetical protein